MPRRDRHERRNDDGDAKSRFTQDRPLDPGRSSPRGPVSLTVLLTLVMAWSMLQLFAVAALAPSIGPDLKVGPAILGSAVGAGFAVAALLSPWAGRLTDRWGPRVCTVSLLLATALALGLVATARDGIGLAVALSLGGASQALANPATNKAISTMASTVHRAGVIGWKQSGVQLGALVAGIPMVLVAEAIGWRWAFCLVAAGALVLALWSLVLLPSDGGTSRVAAEAGTGATVLRLAIFSLFLGVGVSSVSTHLALFSTSALSLSTVQAGVLVAVLGTMGVVGRLFWSARASRSGAAVLLTPMATGAMAGPILLVASLWWPPLVWFAALCMGALAVAANAVSMVAVISMAPSASVGRATAWVAAGFFAGFAVGPPVLGLLAEQFGYGIAWWWPGAALLCAAVTTVNLSWSDTSRGR